MHRLTHARMVVTEDRRGGHITRNTPFTLSDQTSNQFHAWPAAGVHGRGHLSHPVAVMVDANGGGQVWIFGHYASLEFVVNKLPSEQFIVDHGVDFNGPVHGPHFHFTGHRTGIDKGPVPQNALVPNQPEVAVAVDHARVFTVLMKHH